MNKHLSGVMVAVFAAAMLFPSPASADHRPGNVVVMGGTLALTGRYPVWSWMVYYYSLSSEAYAEFLRSEKVWTWP